MPDLTASLEAICARVVGAPWEDAPPIQKANVRERVMEVLNAAVAEGWRSPAGCAKVCGRSQCHDHGCMDRP